MPETQVKTQTDWTELIPKEETAAIIVPLFGYFKDSPVQQFTVKSLQYSLSRVHTSNLKSYIIFVAESDRIPLEIQQFLVTNYSAGNIKGAHVDRDSSYIEYIEEGIDVALNETDAKFIVVVNPWISIREGEIDNMLERLNKGDVSIVSGFDLKTYKNNGTVGIPAEEFDTFVFNPPQASPGFNWNFWAMMRQTAQMITLDIDYKTHYFFERDMIQQFGQKGFIFEQNQNFPIYSFDVDWKLVEPEAEFFEDGQRFLDKWHFSPDGITY